MEKMMLPRGLHASNVILMFNLKTRLVPPQYHVVHDKNFDIVHINKPEAQAQADLDAMLNDLFQSSRWQHTDAHSECDLPIASHHYFNSSWDLAFEQAQAASPHKH
jgi:hypothetical protein